jgi:hypothetical protein
MSFRQKTAFVSAVALLLVYGWYFAQTLQLRAAGAATLGGQFRMLTVAVIGVVAIQILGTVLIVLFSGDRQQPMDERERAIAAGALRTAYFTLLVGALAAVLLAMVDPNVLDVANLAMLAVVLAEIVRYGAYVLLHRVARA